MTGPGAAVATGGPPRRVLRARLDAPRARTVVAPGRVRLRRVPAHASRSEVAPQPTPRPRRANRPASHRALATTVVATGAAVAAVVFLLWFRDGTFYARIDVTPWIRDGLAHELGSTWSHQTSGAGAPTYEVARVPEVAFSRLGVALGGGEELGQRLFLSLVAGAAAAAGAALAACFTRRRWVVAVVGGFAFANPYVLSNLTNTLPVLAIAVAAGATAAACATARGRPKTAWLVVLTLPLSYLAVNPPLLVLLAGWFAIQPAVGAALTGTGRDGATRTLRSLAWAAAFAVPLALWWAVPYAHAILSAESTGTIAAQTDVTAWSWTHAQSSIANVLQLSAAWTMPDPAYHPTAVVESAGWWSWLGLALPAGVVAAPLVADSRRRRPAAWLVLGAMALVPVAKGLHSPLGGANEWAAVNVPGLWLFREPMSKLGVLLVVAYGAALAIALDGAATRLGGWARAVRWRRAFGGAALAGVALVPALLVWPMWTGAITGPWARGSADARVEVPAGWRQLADAINGSDAAGKALVLPLDDFYEVGTTWGYYGADVLVRQLLTRPVLLRNPEAYITDSPSYDALQRGVEAALVAGDEESAAALMRALGVGVVVVRHDLDLGSPMRTPDLAPLAPIEAGLAHLTGSSVLAETDVARAYRIGDAPAAVTALPALATTSSSDPGLLPSLVTAAPTGSALVTGPGSSTGGPSVWAGVAGDGELTLAGGGVAQVRRSLVSPAAYTAALDGGRVVLTDATTIEVGGTTLPARAPVELPEVPGVVVGVVVDGGFHDLTLGSAQVRVGSATTASVVAEQGPELLGAAGPVADCHRAEGSPAETSHRVEVDRRGTITVSAERGVACTTLPVAPVPAGTDLHLSFLARTDGTAAPRSCLWLDGPARCAPMSSLTSPTGDGWVRTSATYVVPSGITGMHLFLYADAAAGPASTAYREVHLVQTVLAGAQALHPGAAPVATIDLGAQDVAHVAVTVTGSVVGLDTWGALDDCRRTDGRSPAQLGLAATPIDGGVRLAAIEHSACVSAMVHGARAGTTVEVDLAARGVSGSTPRMCLWLIGPDRCAPLAPLTAGRGLSAVEQRATLPPGTRGAELFLYADGDGTGTVAEYRDVRVTSVSDEVLVASSLERPSGNAPALRVISDGVSSQRVHVEGASGRYVLALDEAASPGWVLDGLPDGARARPVQLDGYRQAWVVDADGTYDLTVRYGPATWARLATFASAAALVAAVATLVVVRRRRRVPT